jgi:hypothetical protein
MEELVRSSDIGSMYPYVQRKAYKKAEKALIRILWKDKTRCPRDFENSFCLFPEFGASCTKILFCFQVEKNGFGNFYKENKIRRSSKVSAVNVSRKSVQSCSVWWA